MPQIPYQPFSTERPNARGAPTLQIQTPETAFGADVARATSALGRTVQHAGDELFARATALQQLQNETEAREADSQYVLQAAQMRQDFHTKLGRNAGPEALQQFSTDLKGLRDKIRGGLKTDQARKMYDSQSLGFMSREIFSAAGHSATEVKKTAIGSIDASIQATIGQVGLEPGDENYFRQIGFKLKGLIDQKASIGGWTEDQKFAYEQKVISNVYSHRITELAKKDPEKAVQMFEQHKGKLEADDLARVEHSVQTQNRGMASRLYADKAIQPWREDTEGPPLKKLQEDARAAAKKHDSEDPLLPAYFEAAVEQRYYKLQRDIRDTEAKNRIGLNEALLGRITPDGKLPTSLEELLATSKEIEALYNSSGTKTQQWVQSQLVRNAREDYRLTPEGERRYIELLGMKREDPKKFIGLNMAEEKLPLPRRLELVKMQERAHVKAEEDPRVTRALALLSGDMARWGISKRMSEERYYQFVGAVQVGLNHWREETGGKPMPQEEVWKMGARILADVSDPQTWSSFFGFKGESKFFELKMPPQAVQEQMREEYKKRHGVLPTDEKLRQDFLAVRYQELYGGGLNQSDR